MSNSDRETTGLATWPGCLLAIVSIALYTGSSQGEFVFDDRVRYANSCPVIFTSHFAWVDFQLRTLTMLEIKTRMAHMLEI